VSFPADISGALDSGASAGGDSSSNASVVGLILAGAAADAAAAVDVISADWASTPPVTGQLTAVVLAAGGGRRRLGAKDRGARAAMLGSLTWREAALREAASSPPLRSLAVTADRSGLSGQAAANTTAEGLVLSLVMQVCRLGKLRVVWR
jgi:hypothetical protein